MALLRTQIGRKIQDAEGNVISGATATILSLPSLSEATVYANESGTATIAQPSITGIGGDISGWLEIGDYSITIESSSGTSTSRYYANHPQQSYLETYGNDVPLTVKAGAALSSNMAEWQNPSGGTVMSVSTAGSITSPTVTAIQGSVTNTQGSVNSTQGSVNSTQGSVSSHASTTISVHGITNTANLVYTNNATLGSVATINASLGSVAGTVTDLFTQPFGTVDANYIIGIGDSNKLIKTTSATAITITLPPNGSVAFSVGQGFDIVQMAAGTVTFGTAAAGTAGTVTILSTPSLILRTQNSAARVVKTDTNEWFIMGDMF